MRLNVSDCDINSTDKDYLLQKLKDIIAIRNRMGGAMYYNMCNDDAHTIVNRLLSIGADINSIMEVG